MSEQLKKNGTTIFIEKELKRSKTEIERLREEVESSLKAFDMSSNKFHLQHNRCIDVSVKAKKQVLYNVGLFERFEKEHKFLTDCNTFKKGEEEI